MQTVALIQARIGSSRLPGKTMYPLDGVPVLGHCITRTGAAETVGGVLVATSTARQDDVIESQARRTGVDVVRGSETDVLGRLHHAVDTFTEAPAEIVRICADSPLVPPAVIDSVVTTLRSESLDYVSTLGERTLPRGLDAEAFTTESFDAVERRANQPHEREHVTVYYREQADEFETGHVSATEIFDDERLHGRTDLRLTLDEAADFELLREIYDGVQFETILDVREAIRFVDEHGLATVNADVTQTQATTASEE
jgi:spore coat polysaccharide biosynthesis protein SpsF